MGQNRRKNHIKVIKIMEHSWKEKKYNFIFNADLERSQMRVYDDFLTVENIYDSCCDDLQTHYNSDSRHSNLRKLFQR